MSDVDWSKAGKRIRWSPRTPDGRNSDWMFAEQRWKDEADYAADTLSIAEVRAMVSCMACKARKLYACTDAAKRTMHDGNHAVRTRHAGQKVIANGKR